MDAGFLMMRSFSVVHRLQALDPGLYDWHFVRIFQFMLYLVPSFFNFQISFESSVTFRASAVNLYNYIYNFFNVKLD